MAASEGVKSARRVFTILEYFAEIQREASASEVARACEFPSSSTSALMRQMTEVGYLHFDRGRRTYRPTPRLPLVCDWINQRVFPADAIHKLMQSLSDATGETILLGLESGNHVRYIRVIDGSGALRLYSMHGASRDYAATSIGQALLSTWPQRRVQGYVHRYNAGREPAQRISAAQMAERLDRFRQCGYIVSTGGQRGVGSVGMLLPRADDQHVLAVAVAGAMERVRESAPRLAQVMRDCIARTFGVDAPAGA